MVSFHKFDPRRAMNFPTDLLGLSEKDGMASRRLASEMKKDSGPHEFWIVRKDFDLEGFAKKVESFPTALLFSFCPLLIRSTTSFDSKVNLKEQQWLEVRHACRKCDSNE
jgi:hypothetical protein